MSGLSLTLPEPDESPAGPVFSSYLRELRLSLDLTLTDAAAVLGCSKAKASRLETGRLHRVVDAMRLMKRYGVGNQSLTAIYHLLQEPPRSVLTDAVPGWLDRLHACQRQADSLVIYTAYSLPDIARIPEHPVEVLTQLLRANVSVRVPPREALTGDNGQGVTLLLDEMVLHRPLGGPSVMAEQVLHLQQLARSEKGPQIRVVPLSAHVLPPSGLLHHMTLHGHDLVAEEWGDFVLYHVGETATQWRHRFDAALAAAAPADEAAGYLGEAHARFEEAAAELVGSSHRRA